MILGVRTRTTIANLIQMIGTLELSLIALVATGCSHDLGTSTCNSSGDDGDGVQIIYSQRQIQEC